MNTIESTRHPLIQSTSTLAQKKARDESGLILVETKHPIEEALKAGLTPTHYFYLADTPASMRPEWADTSLTFEVNEAVMKKLSTTDSIPPCIAVFKKPNHTLESLLSIASNNKPFFVVADRMQDPGNLGTLIRTACAFSGNGILLTQESVDPYSPKVIRSSAGLVFHLPIVLLNQPLENCLSNPALSQYQWLFTTGHDIWQDKATEHYRDVDYKKPSILVLGNEGQGLAELEHSPELAKAIRIPTSPTVESLNVSISAAIILAQAYHHKNQSPEN
jgi:TrmH family RNA methyltransferase